jgi:hypothetical protein
MQLTHNTTMLNIQKSYRTFLISIATPLVVNSTPLARYFKRLNGWSIRLSRTPNSNRATYFGSCHDKKAGTVSNILFSSCVVCLLNLIFFKSNLGWLAHETEPLRTSKKNYSTEFYCHVVSSTIT